MERIMGICELNMTYLDLSDCPSVCSTSPRLFKDQSRPNSGCESHSQGAMFKTHQKIKIFRFSPFTVNRTISRQGRNSSHAGKFRESVDRGGFCILHCLTLFAEIREIRENLMQAKICCSTVYSFEGVSGLVSFRRNIVCLRKWITPND